MTTNFDTEYDFDEDGVTVTIKLGWGRADWILSKGSLEDNEEEAVYYAVKAAQKDAKAEGIDVEPDYDEED